MPSRQNSISRGLTSGPVTLTTAQSARKVVRRIIMIVVVAAVAGAFALQYMTQQMSQMHLTELGVEIRTLETELEGTRKELERALLDLEIASVTRAELERQLVVLTEQHKQVREELEFVKSAAVRTRSN